MKFSYLKLKSISIAVFFCMSANLAFACSCLDRPSFCDIVQSDQDRVVFKGRTLEIVEHPQLIHSLLVEVTKIFYGEDILTDTIELLGADMSSACRLLLYGIELDKEYYFALNDHSWGSLGNVEWKGLNENRWAGTPSLCHNGIYSFDDENVYGLMMPNVYKYPIEFFERDLIGCGFQQDIVDDSYCPDFRIGPNPIRSNRIIISDPTHLSSIRSVRLFTPNGALIKEIQAPNIGRIIKLPKLDVHFIIAELYCGEERIVKKLLVGDYF